MKYLEAGSATMAVDNAAANLNWECIESEEYREYDFGDHSVRIEMPVWLAVSKTGHRVFDMEGISHFIPNGWRHLHWKALSEAPNFVK